MRDLKKLAPLIGRLPDRSMSPEFSIPHKVIGAVLQGKAVLNLPLNRIGGFLRRAAMERKRKHEACDEDAQTPCKEE